MIYIVSWNEPKGPQSLFFESSGRADFFADRLLRRKHCKDVVVAEEPKTKAAISNDFLDGKTKHPAG